MLRCFKVCLILLGIFSFNVIADLKDCTPADSYTRNQFKAVIESTLLGYTLINNRSIYACTITVKNLSVKPMTNLEVVPIIADNSSVYMNQMCAYFSEMYKLDRVVVVDTCVEKSTKVNYLTVIGYDRVD